MKFAEGKVERIIKKQMQSVIMDEAEYLESNKLCILKLKIFNAFSRPLMLNVEYRYTCKESNMKEMLLILAKDLK